MKLSLADARVNDLIRVSRVYRVTAELSDYGWDDCVVGKDEKSGDVVEIYDEGGTQVIELLHRPSKKPELGAVLTPDEVCRVQWKRGTVLQNTTSGSVLTLMPDGTWVNSSRGLHRIGFDEFAILSEVCPEDKFKVLHVTH